ncbi:unnamed protein product, partial [Dovyalis caffra]
HTLKEAFATTQNNNYSLNEVVFTAQNNNYNLNETLATIAAQNNDYSLKERLVTAQNNIYNPNEVLGTAQNINYSLSLNEALATMADQNNNCFLKYDREIQLQGTILAFGIAKFRIRLLMSGSPSENPLLNSLGILALGCDGNLVVLDATRNVV